MTDMILIKKNIKKDSIDAIYELNEPIGEHKHYKKDVYYTKGTYNKPRGYYLSSRPITYEVKDGYESYSYMMYDSNSKLIFLEEATRLNRNKLNELANIHLGGRNE